MLQHIVAARAPTDGAPTDGAPLCLVRVGGTEFVVGGWHAHEAVRRSAAIVSGGETDLYRQLYHGRTFIHARDAAESLGAATWRRGAALAHSLRDLAGELEQFEACLWAALGARTGPDSVSVPPMSAADLREAADSERLGSDADALADLGAALQQVGAAFGVAFVDGRPTVAALPAGPPVDVADSDAVADLERRTVPHLESLERLQAELSTRAVAAKQGVKRARRRITKHTTGDAEGGK